MNRTLLLITLILTTLPAFALPALNILLTNDDGYTAPGITALHKALISAGHQVTLVAPATQQSGASASMSSRGVTFTKAAEGVYAVKGKPADAVRLALTYLLKDSPPDLVISGINFGQNVGQEVIVSGTVGAAVTARHLGVPAIAVSAEILIPEADKGFPSTMHAFPGAAQFVTRLLAQMAKLPKHGVLNVNYPATDVKGVVDVEVSNHSLFAPSYRQQEDGSLAVNFSTAEPLQRGSDSYELRQGYICLSWLDGSYAEKPNRSLGRLARKLDRGFR